MEQNIFNIGFFIDGKLVNVMRTDTHTAAVLLSNPTMFDIGDTPWQIGDEWDNASKMFYSRNYKSFGQHQFPQDLGMISEPIVQDQAVVNPKPCGCK